jgi:integrase
LRRFAFALTLDLADLRLQRIDIATIALWLGHESIETTRVYLEVDLATKEQALQKLATVEDQEVRFTADDPLFAFLTSL